MLAVGIFLWMPFNRPRKFPIPKFLSVCNHEKSIFLNIFPMATEMIMWFGAFFFSEVIYYIKWFWYVEPTLYP